MSEENNSKVPKWRKLGATGVLVASAAGTVAHQAMQNNLQALAEKNSVSENQEFNDSIIFKHEHPEVIAEAKNELKTALVSGLGNYIDQNPFFFTSRNPDNVNEVVLMNYDAAKNKLSNSIMYQLLLTSASGDTFKVPKSLKNEIKEEVLSDTNVNIALQNIMSALSVSDAFQEKLSSIGFNQKGLNKISAEHIYDFMLGRKIAIIHNISLDSKGKPNGIGEVQGAVSNVLDGDIKISNAYFDKREHPSAEIANPEVSTQQVFDKKFR